MKTRVILSLGLSALVFGGTMVGCSAADGGGEIASAGNRNADLAAKAAAVNAGKAQAALAKRDGVTAVTYAEAAVGMMPQSAEYRSMLGQGYLQAGRFASARQSFADVLALTPNDGRAALNLALTQIAEGDGQTAQATLMRNAAIIPASDRGLAMALAGDPAGAIVVLSAVVRSPAGNAKARQNLALSYALSGQWQAARVVAATDMAPADVDARLEQWAAFAQPVKPYDQVASLLGVRAVADAGQPVALALNRAPLMQAPTQALATVEPVEPTPTEVADNVVVQAVPAATPAAVAGFTRVTFGPRREVVQTVPSMMLRQALGQARGVRVASDRVASDRGASDRGGDGRRMARAAFAVRAVAPAASGDWYVQIGAFDNAGVARDAWGRATRRFAAFSGRQPNGMTFKANGEDYYRLSVGGFGRGEADRVCRSYRATGGACFVRQGAGDQMAQWLRKSGMQLASR